MTWIKEHGRTCPRPSKDQQYETMQDAVAACLKAGAKCGVIENFYCRESSKQFYVCSTEMFFSRFVKSNVGTCVMRTSDQPTLGVLSVELVLCVDTRGLVTDDQNDVFVSY